MYKKEVSHIGTYGHISLTSPRLLNKQLGEWQRYLSSLAFLFLQWPRKYRLWSMISPKWRF